MHRFALAEFCTAMAHAVHVDVLVAMGLDPGAGRAKMKGWSLAGKSVTLRLASKELCKFLREVNNLRIIITIIIIIIIIIISHSYCYH